MVEDLKTQFKEVKEKERNTGLFILALFFGLFFSITGNIIYDLFIKGHFYFQIYFLILSIGLIVFLIREIRVSEKRMKEMEQTIKELEKQGGEN